jgi:hypothetical protein
MYLTVAPAILFSIQLCRSRRNADPRRSFWRVALTHRLAWIALAAIAALVASNLEIFGNWTGTDAVRAQHARFEAIPAFSMASLESLFWLARTLLFSETTWFGDRIQPWTGAWTTHLAIAGFAIGWLAAVSLRTPNAAGDRAESSVLWLSMISVGALAAEFALITNLGGINFDHGRFLYPMLPVFLALAMEGFFRLGGRAPGQVEQLGCCDGILGMDRGRSGTARERRAIDARGLMAPRSDERPWGEREKVAGAMRHGTP